METTTLVGVLLTAGFSILASTGFWAFMQKKVDTNTTMREMLIGLAHDRIMCLGMYYIQRGYITTDEFENLNNYLYEPYAKLGGNGSAARVMAEVKKLPIRTADSKGAHYETR